MRLGATGPGTTQGGRYYDIIVGNAVVGDTLALCDFLDTGNGMQLKAALAAAGAANPPKSVFVRRGPYDLSAAGSDFTAVVVPQSVLMQCDGQGSTVILSQVKTQLLVLEVQAGASARDLTVFIQPIQSNAGNAVAFVLVDPSGDLRDATVNFEDQVAGFAALWGSVTTAVRAIAGDGLTALYRVGTRNMPSRTVDGSGTPSISFLFTGTADRRALISEDCISVGDELPLGGSGLVRVPDIGMELLNAAGMRITRPILTGSRQVGLRPHGNAGTTKDVEVVGLDARWITASAVQRRGVQLFSEAAGVVDGVKLTGGYIDCFTDTHASIGIDVRSTGAASSTKNCETDGVDPHNFAEAAHVESVAAGLVNANGIVNTRVSDNTAPINNVNDGAFRTGGNW